MSTVPNDGGTVPEHTASFVLQGVICGRGPDLLDRRRIATRDQRNSSAFRRGQQRIVPTV